MREELIQFIKIGCVPPKKQELTKKSARHKSQKSKIEEKSFCLRMTSDIAEKISLAVNDKVPKVSKNSWILGAVLEKLKKEKI